MQNIYFISMLHFTASYLSSRLGIVCQTFHTFVPITCSSLVAVARYRWYSTFHVDGDCFRILLWIDGYRLQVGKDWPNHLDAGKSSFLWHFMTTITVYIIYFWYLCLAAANFGESTCRDDISQRGGGALQNIGTQCGEYQFWIISHNKVLCFTC